MLVRDAMSKSVVSISPGATIAEALDAMVRSRVSGLPIVDESGRLVGMVSEGDFLRRSELGAEKTPGSWIASLLLPGKAANAYARAHGRRIDEIMSGNVATVEPNASLGEAAALMEKRRVKRLPVVENDKVVGILSRADFMRALAQIVRPNYEEQPASDEDIKRSIVSELRAQAWAPIASIDVAVTNGVVSFRGVLTDERQRHAIRAVAENVQGVLKIHDHMIWTDPFTATVLPSPEDEEDDRALATRR